MSTQRFRYRPRATRFARTSHSQFVEIAPHGLVLRKSDSWINLTRIARAMGCTRDTLWRHLASLPTIKREPVLGYLYQGTYVSIRSALQFCKDQRWERFIGPLEELDQSIEMTVDPLGASAMVEKTSGSATQDQLRTLEQPESPFLRANDISFLEEIHPVLEPVQLSFNFDEMQEEI